MIRLILDSFDDDHIRNTRKRMSDREAEMYIKKILRDNSIDLHDYHGNVGGIGWTCIETYKRGLPDGWEFTDDLTGINAYIDLDGNILRRYDDLETVYSTKYYRSQGGTRDIPESIRVRKLKTNIRSLTGNHYEKVLENKNCKRGKYMIRPINEGFENESFVAYYKGNLFYTGDLDDDFQQSILELIKDDKEALKSVSDYLYYVGIEDFDVNDPEEVAYLLEKDMYYDAIDGQDYWGFDDFEIFPEYELDESIRRRLKSTRTTRRVK